MRDEGFDGDDGQAEHSTTASTGSTAERTIAYSRPAMAPISAMFIRRPAATPSPSPCQYTCAIQRPIELIAASRQRWCW
jgi:hypothetical protein